MQKEAVIPHSIFNSDGLSTTMMQHKHLKFRTQPFSLYNRKIRHIESANTKII
jgi:hypothetical protein